MNALKLAYRTRQYQKDLALANSVSWAAGTPVTPDKFVNQIRNRGDKMVEAAAQEYFRSVEQTLIEKNKQLGTSWVFFTRWPANRLFNNRAEWENFAHHGNNLDQGLNYSTFWAIWWLRYSQHVLTGITGYHFVVESDPVLLQNAYTALKGEIIVNDYAGFLSKNQDNLQRVNNNFDDD